MKRQSCTKKYFGGGKSPNLIPFSDFIVFGIFKPGVIFNNQLKIILSLLLGWDSHDFKSPVSIALKHFYAIMDTISS